MEKVTIRQATLNDLDLLLAFEQAIIEAELDDLPADLSPRMAKWLTALRPALQQGS